MNYDLEMENQIKNISTKNKLLLHACCAPCSSAVLERISKYFDITILYYNPNITEPEEYEKRLNEIENFVKKLNLKNIKVLRGRYNPKEFFDISVGLEKEKERGKRCYKCYELRLKETAKVAEELNFDYFTTTLSISPYKNSKWLNEIGENLNKEFKPTYLYADFKKKNGYKRSIELSQEYGLYRQDYCGCIYSKKERELAKLSHIS
ncbi:MAG: epoxyqueuosine reductase QueH [Candidatus Faecimonas sp.]|nr:epoxyqueuosine reductase QueH [Mycoplasmatota bacterium]MDY2908309.1 epoxyqueuosine reductase QueH [Candidatus Faecimonas sp.]